MHHVRNDTHWYHYNTCLHCSNQPCTGNPPQDFCDRTFPPHLLTTAREFQPLIEIQDSYRARKPVKDPWPCSRQCTAVIHPHCPSPVSYTHLFHDLLLQMLLMFVKFRAPTGKKIPHYYESNTGAAHRRCHDSIKDCASSCKCLFRFMPCSVERCDLLLCRKRLFQGEIIRPTGASNRTRWVLSGTILQYQRQNITLIFGHSDFFDQSQA